MGKAREIVDAVSRRMENLGFEESNTLFTTELIPSTLRDKSFTVRFESGTPDFNRKAINKIVTIERNMTVLVIHKTGADASGKRMKKCLRDAYDDEEEVIKSIMAVRVDNTVVFETLDSVSTELIDEASPEWLLTTFSFRIKYELNLF